MFDNMKFRTQLLVGNVTVLTLMIIIGLVVHTSTSQLIENSKMVEHTHKVMAEGNALQAYLVDMETG